jgi:RNA polymerase sigma factor, sigma-70 family
MDGDVFVREVKLLSPTLFRISMSILRHEQDAQDALQQALEKAWTKRECVHEGTFKPWLTSILVNECRDMLRRKKRILVTDTFAEKPVPAHDMSLRDALDRLAEKYRTPFLLKYMENFSEKEIAAMLRLPGSTIRGRLYRAKQQLQVELNEKEAERV